MRRRDFIVLLGWFVFSPLEALTQQRSVGFFSAGSPDAYAPFVAAFRAGIGDAG